MNFGSSRRWTRSKGRARKARSTRRRNASPNALLNLCCKELAAFCPTLQVRNPFFSVTRLNHQRITFNPCKANFPLVHLISLRISWNISDWTRCTDLIVFSLLSCSIHPNGANVRNRTVVRSSWVGSGWHVSNGAVEPSELHWLQARVWQHLFHTFWRNYSVQRQQHCEASHILPGMKKIL